MDPPEKATMLRLAEISGWKAPSPNLYRTTSPSMTVGVLSRIGRIALLLPGPDDLELASLVHVRHDR